MLTINSKLRIPQDEIEFSYARSSGPGGQNVNKVSSKAQLRWPVAQSTSLPEDVRRRFLHRYANRITDDGELVLASQRYRDQKRNVADCLDKLKDMLLAVATPPVPRKRTRPTKASGQRRLETKRAASRKKQARRRPSAEE